MAVPKKRTSKSKKNTRKFTWKQKATKQAAKAISLGKSLENNPFEESKAKGFGT